jgi:hypothetical protein
MLGINSSRPHRYSVDSEDNVVTEEIEEDFEKNDSDSESVSCKNTRFLNVT